MSDLLTIKFKHTFEEYLESHLVAARIRRLTTRLTFGALGITLIVMGISIPIEHQFGNFNWIVLFGAALLLNVTIISPLRFRYFVKRLWDRYPAIHNEVPITFSDKGITHSDDLGNPIFIDWKNYFRWEETKNMFLLYISPGLWNLIPKRILTPVQESKVREILAQHLPS